MSFFFGALGAALILVVLGDAFETIALPRRVTRRTSLARFFYQSTWFFWATSVRSIFSRKRQETWLSWYGPLSLLLLLIFWATGLVIGFGVVHWASGSIIKTPDGASSFATYLYLSGTTFFTLGLGDVHPVQTFGKGLIAFESGMGFGFLALVIGYIPALNQSFSRREVNISLLDARAGSPPTATEMLRRHGHDRGMEDLQQLFHEWERWSADLLESHLSYPALCYFRSHHDNQSWLGALTAILDASAFAIVSLEGHCERQAQLTFAITRHTVVDLAQILDCRPHKPKHDRLTPEELARMRAVLTEAGLKLREGEAVDQKLSDLRQMYEPYIYSLSVYLHVAVPSWNPRASWMDSWQTSAWGRSRGFEIEDRTGPAQDEHF